MAEQTIIHTKLDGLLQFASQCTAATGGFDATGSVATGADSYVVAFEAGDLSLTIPGSAVSSYLDRGKLRSPPALRYGDDQAVTFSFSAYFRDMVSTGSEGLMDILNRTGLVASTPWISTLSSSGSTDDAEVFAVDLMWQVENQGSASDTHLMVLPYCTLSYSLAEGDPNTISISGTSWAAAPSVIL